MARYAYRCPADGELEISRPIGTAPQSVRCPLCAAVATRVISAPMVGRADPVRAALIERTEATRSEPAVVAAPPVREGRARARTPDPRTSRLPRP